MMLDYELAGKQVVLVLEAETLKKLAPLGIPGSPLYGKVFKSEDEGLRMENHSFPLCPLDQPKVLDAEGNAMCHAHVFIPKSAIVSLAVFPEAIEEPEGHPSIHSIGFVGK